MSDRRKLIQAIGVSTFALGMLGQNSFAETAGAADIVSLEDERVRRFLAYRRDVKKQALQAIQDLMVADFVYVSSSGQSFDADGLARRVRHWAEGFEVISSKGLWAASVGDRELIIATRDEIVHRNAFRGVPATNAKLRVDSLFLITYAGESSEKIATYTRYCNYGLIAKALGTKRLSALHDMS